MKYFYFRKTWWAALSMFCKAVSNTKCLLRFMCTEDGIVLMCKVRNSSSRDDEGLILGLRYLGQLLIILCFAALGCVVLVGRSF